MKMGKSCRCGDDAQGDDNSTHSPQELGMEVREACKCCEGAQRQDNRTSRPQALGKSSTCLNSLQTVMPAGINSLDLQGEWEEIELAVDSGATETVVGVKMLAGVETEEGKASKMGVQYEVADG